MRSLLLKDGKTLTLEFIEDDWIFFLFYLYGKTRNKQLQPNSILEYKRDMNVLLEFLVDPANAFNTVGLADPAPPSCSLKDIGRLQLRAYERYIKERYAPNSAVRKLSFLKSILRFGYEKGVVSHNFRDEFSIGQKVVAMTERKLNYEELPVVLNELRKKPILTEVLKVGKSHKYIHSKIGIRQDKMKGFQHPQYVITINDITLNDYLNQNTQSRSFDLLVPPIGLFDNRDQQRVLELLSFINVTLPILVCSDDMDFSCTVVATNVEEGENYIIWKTFGYGVDMSKPIHVPPLTFEKDVYREFVEAFKGFIQEY